MNKIFIVSSVNNLTQAKEVADYISETFEMTIASRFSNDTSIEDTTYMPTEDIMVAYKNNALLYSQSLSPSSFTGISFDEYYNNDILIIPINGFINISESIFDEDSLVIWLDCPKQVADIKEVKNASYIIDIIENVKYLYFNESNSIVICSVLNKYFNGSESDKANILEENS